MRITDVLIEDRIKEKVFNIHSITALEIKHIMLSNPYVLKARENRYMAIGYYQKFITIIFEMMGTIAFIITAYLSSSAQMLCPISKR